jgi:transposase
MTLVSQRTSCKNQIHAILHKHGIWHGYSDLFGSRGEEFLKDLDLPDPVRHMVENYWQIIEELKARIAGTQALIRKEIPEDELIGLLMTIPGIGPLLSRVIRYELWDIDRFESFKKLMSYVGTAPATWQSAESVSHGGITRQGNTYVRWAIVEEAQHVKRARDPYLLWKYTRLSKRRGRMKARMAVACDILQAVYFVWKRREPFRPKPAPKSFIRLVRVKKKRRASNQ